MRRNVCCLILVEGESLYVCAWPIIEVYLGENMNRKSVPPNNCITW